VRQAEVQRLATAESQQRFDLTQAPLIRVRLLRLAETEHVLLVTMHHIVADGWSLGVFWHELAALYNAYAGGNPVPLPALPIQYADFAAWQREWLQGEVLEAQLAYWKQQLAGARPVLELPADHPRPVMQTYRGARQWQVLPKRLAHELQALSQREGSTLFMTLLAAFTTLLSRYTGQEDILVGCPVANRNSGELEGLIGCFVNTLGLRTDLSGDPSFRELLRRVREFTLGAYAHQDLPFEKLVEALQPERDLNRHPLFQVMFVLQNTPMPVLKLPTLTLNPLEIEKGTAKFALTLFMTESDEGLVGLWEYKTDLFEPATITRMLGHFQTLLEGIVAQPGQSISTLPLLTEHERHQLLVEWNNTQADYPKDSCLQQLFEAQVERTPDAIAVVRDDVRLTYRELNVRANRIAQFLMGHGVGPDVVVALLAERGVDFLAAMLGVFKAGGAYLPLDPRHVAERLCQVLDQSGTTLLLAAGQFLPAVTAALERRPIGTRIQVLAIEELLQSESSDENPPALCTPKHLAYVIYTSGSTGIPKGAMVEQRGILNHLYAKIADLKLTGADVVAQSASQCFDISVWQFLAPLLVGGRVHIFPDDVAQDAWQLFEQVQLARVSILEIVPPLLRVMLEEAERRGPGRPNLSSLRWLISTGEALPPELCRQWLSSYPSIPLLNAYGPTECSDDVSHYAIGTPPGPDMIHTPIGRPIANMRLYVLNPQLQPAPIGVPGELYIAGDGVGRGYLDQPEFTAEAFIPDPFSGQRGARLYKTGDLVRSLQDGTLVYLGRLDPQLKIRGYRVEPGEIEAVLGQHAAVRQAVVVAREDIPGDKRLVAYLDLHPEPASTAQEPHHFLQQRLPHYMVPAVFVFLDALPLTPNGKVDRYALPAPDPFAPMVKRTFVSPRTAVEEVLAGIWAEVLGLERIGIDDNFFDLGGHSLLAIRIRSRIHSIFQVELSLRRLFEAPTAAELAEAIIANEAKPGQTEKTARILKRIEAMSAADVKDALQKKSMQGGAR
jgi:amino acid adenylation domain-containing protein